MDKYAQSLLELLLQIPGLQIQIMPGLKPNIGLHTNDPKAKMLMAVWDDAGNKIADKKFRRPATMSNRDAIDLEGAGYIKQHGENLVMTQKGIDLIKIMLLNDDSHAFDKNTTSQKSGSMNFASRHGIKRASVVEPCFKHTLNWYKKSKINGKE